MADLITHESEAVFPLRLGDVDGLALAGQGIEGLAGLPGIEGLAKVKSTWTGSAGPTPPHPWTRETDSTAIASSVVCDQKVRCFDIAIPPDGFGGIRSVGVRTDDFAAVARPKRARSVS